jgi:hypothetical protein
MVTFSKPVYYTRPLLSLSLLVNNFRFGFTVYSHFVLASDDEFENLRIKGPNAVQLVKTTPLKPSSLPVIPDTIKEVIYDMLNALAAYHAPEEGM